MMSSDTSEADLATLALGVAALMRCFPNPDPPTANQLRAALAAPDEDAPLMEHHIPMPHLDLYTIRPAEWRPAWETQYPLLARLRSEPLAAALRENTIDLVVVPVPRCAQLGVYWSDYVADKAEEKLGRRIHTRPTIYGMLRLNAAGDTISNLRVIMYHSGLNHVLAKRAKRIFLEAFGEAYEWDGSSERTMTVDLDES